MNGPSHWPGAGIVLVPHRPSWSLEFQRESRAIAAKLGPGLVDVQHIGSTAVPGIVAKPIVDMLAVVRDLQVLDEATPAMESLGYEAKGEFGLPGRRYFRKNSRDGSRTHHVHSFQKGSPEAVRLVAFRDFLIAHSDAAHAYAALKLDLASRVGADMKAYSEGKSAFIKDIERQALAELRDLGARHST